MTDKEIFVELSTELTREHIIRKAVRDHETPLGYLLTVIRDNYGRTKAGAWDIAENLIKFFDI